ncbi:hypothetical protein CVT25_006431 [Psilocybe cyanescens]|uniref:Telomere length regulation protein conserved domain-containing protein n=1 Tax=Psilocybe cyanescens TaxID=93625 RepID=A0A409XE39_PSICY|nr:hypothetical protein CVT25_006431 [Psilocybe cyanescens]
MSFAASTSPKLQEKVQEKEKDARKQIQDLIEQLRGDASQGQEHPRIEDVATLLSVLAPPLDGVGLLPPRFRVYLGGAGVGAGASARTWTHFIPQIQRVLLTHVVPTWGEELLRLDQGDKANLKEKGKEKETEREGRGGLALIDQYFCPDGFVNGSEAAGEVARAAYATLVSAPSALEAGGYGSKMGHAQRYGYGVSMLARLAVEYPIDRLYKSVFLNGKGDGDGVLKGVGWEDCVRDVCKVPAVVANALAARESGGGMRWGGEVPDVLENAAYFDRMSMRCEELILFLSSSTSTSVEQESLTYLLTKLVNLGVFPPRPPVARSQPSFFQSALPAIRARLSSTSASAQQKYSAFWTALLQNIASSSSITLQSILASLFASLHVAVPPSSSPSPSQISPSTHIPALSEDTTTRARVTREAALLRALVGAPSPDNAPALWQIATSLVLSRDWPLAELHARVFVAWISGAASVVLDAFLNTVLDVWASPEHIKHSLLSRHRYMTSLLLLTISYFPSTSTSSPPPAIQNLVSSPAFIGAIGTCGMLAAEVVAHLCGRKLDFGGWDGQSENEGLGWCRVMRALLSARDVDVDVDADDEHRAADADAGVNEDEDMEDISAPGAAASTPAPITPTTPPTRAIFLPKSSTGYDSDDSLTGYASPPSAASSRASSPTPSELAEIEKDPTLNVGVKKVPRPVYLAQLGELLRAASGGAGGKTGPNDAHDADRVQMALDCAEGLIRRKMGYGTELDENAVNLVHAFLSLQDNFDLDGFSEKRQAALTALVACAPTKATPALIQEFFKNQYSTDQRFVALNALAMGARELADLPVPPTPSTSNPGRTAFPSKMLPGPLHRKYISAGDAGAGGTEVRGIADRNLLPRMVEQLATDALDEHREEAGRTAGSPALIRERRLRVQKPQLVSEIPSSASSSSSAPLNPFARSDFQPGTPKSKARSKFIDIAAEHFILPFISSFWAFLRDTQALEQRTAHLSGRARYRGAGTGLILNPLVLAQFVRTLAVLVHAARNAREWMALVAPEALEVAVTLGTRPVSSMDEDGVDDGDDDEAQSGGGKGGPAGANKEASLLTATLELALVVLDGALELDGGRVLGLEHTALILGLGEWAGKVFSGLERGLRVQGGGGAHEARLSRAAAGVLLKVNELTSKWSRSMIDL